MAVSKQYRFSGLTIVISLCIVALAVYFSYPIITDQTEHSAAPEYSFEKPGQLKQPENKSPNRFSSLSPEELASSAQSIIDKADQLIKENPIKTDPLTEEQQAELDQKIEDMWKRLDGTYRVNGER